MKERVEVVQNINQETEEKTKIASAKEYIESIQNDKAMQYQFDDEEDMAGSGEISSRKRNRKENRRYLTGIQIAVCTGILLILLLLHLMKSPIYDMIREWYAIHINDSIVAKETLDVWKKSTQDLFSSSENTDRSENFISESIS